MNKMEVEFHGKQSPPKWVITYLRNESVGGGEGGEGGRGARGHTFFQMEVRQFFGKMKKIFA